MEPDLSFLNSPSTVYPVTIDPAVYMAYAYYSRYMIEGDAAAHDAEGQLRIGPDPVTGLKSRSFISWTVNDLVGKFITDADVALWNYESKTCTPTSWEIWTTQKPLSTHTWANQPTWLSKEASSTDTYGATTACGNNWAMIDGTTFFQKAATANQTQAYMGIRATSESLSNAFKKFSSRNAPAQMTPWAMITYSSTKIASQATESALGCVTGSARPTVNTSTPMLSATFSDPTPNGSKVRATFEYGTLTGSALGSETVPETDLGQPARVMIPMDVLSSGGTYRWRTRAIDAAGTGTTFWSNWCEFTVHSIFSTPTTLDSGGEVVPPENVSASEGPEVGEPGTAVIPGVNDGPGGETPTSTTSQPGSAMYDEEGPEDVDSSAGAAAASPPPTFTNSSDTPQTQTQQPTNLNSCPVAADGSKICVTQEEAPNPDATAGAAGAGGEAASNTWPYTVHNSRSDVPSTCKFGRYGWWTSRFESCYLSTWRLSSYDNQNNLLGSYLYLEARWSKQWWDYSDWDYKVFLTAYQVSGNPGRFTVSPVGATCLDDTGRANVDCSADYSFTGAWFQSGYSTARFDARIRQRVTTGRQQVRMGRLDYMFVNDLNRRTASVRPTSNWVRCDKNLKGSNSVGCVVPNHTPAALWSLTGPYSEMAVHLQKAVASGLPWNLRRMYNDSNIAANRRQACPGSNILPRPYGKSCDEYPFASTYNGAAMGSNPKNPRSFKGCSVPPDADYGPVGYSRCMINASQNERGGSELGRFYGAHGGRVLDGDYFAVVVVS